jgi:hypothetical protein
VSDPRRSIEVYKPPGALAWTLVSPASPMSFASPALLTAEATNLQPKTMWESRMVKSPRDSGFRRCSFSTCRVMVIRSVRCASAAWSISSPPPRPPPRSPARQASDRSAERDLTGCSRAQGISILAPAGRELGGWLASA